MRVFLLIILFLLISDAAFAKGYDLTVPLVGDSIADNSLQFKVLTDVYSFAGKKFPSCYNLSVTDTQVLKYPYDVRKVNDVYKKAKWEELWTLRVCNKTVQIPVSFFIKGGKPNYVINPLLFTK